MGTLRGALVVTEDLRGGHLEGGGRGGILCRGEVAERLNAAVSKTVMSVIPASGVRIPPSPLVGNTPHPLY
jgi:hypothetical protein